MALSCEQAQTQLSRSLDGELEAATRAAMDAHVVECARCTRARGGLTSTDAILQGALGDPALFGDDVAESIVASLRAASQTANEQTSDRVAPRAQPRRWGWVAAAAVAAIVAGVAWPDRPEVAPPQVAAAPVVATAGVGWVRVGDTTDQPLHMGDAVRAEETLRATAAPAALRLACGSVIFAEPGTAVRVVSDEHGTRIGLAGPGAVYCEVTPQQRPFRVEGQRVSAEVLGTRFVVREGDNVGRVVVLEGSVRARSRGGERVLVRDQAAEVSGDSPPALLEVTARAFVRGWVPDERLPARPVQQPAEPRLEEPVHDPQPVQEPPAMDPDLDAPVTPPTPPVPNDD